MGTAKRLRLLSLRENVGVRVTVPLLIDYLIHAHLAVPFAVHGQYSLAHDLVRFACGARLRVETELLGGAVQAAQFWTGTDWLTKARDANNLLSCLT